MSNEKLSPIEAIKIKSDGLRGTLKESLKDNYTGNVRTDDEALVKFHGMYVQDDRDRRTERAEKKLDNLYSFMIRLRIPGGKISSDQWQSINDISEEYGTGTIKITTRQTIQLHGILKHQLQDTLRGFLIAKLDSIAACGDVNRNVICSSHPQISTVYEEIHAYADAISLHLMPKTQAYYEVFIDDEKVYERSAEQDNLYENRYLPRKFKIAIAIPPSNDVDIFANDAGLIAIIKDEKLLGFNLAVGGGLSTTHGNPNTYSRLATEIGFIDSKEKVMKALYEVLTIQRDYGNRSDRKLARLKYTVDRMGVDDFKDELERRCGFKLQPVQPYEFTERNDRYGWQESKNGLWHYTLFVENGVIKPNQKEFLKRAATFNQSDILFTGNQNLIIGNIQPENRMNFENLIKEFSIELNNSEMRKSSMACVALPTCPLALAEAQRYLPELVSKIEPLLEKHQLQEDEISIRMTGCPNGCGKSYLAEIGFVGTGPGRYNFMLGGDRMGVRLNQIYKKNVDETTILSELDELFARYKSGKKTDETFGDFTYRTLSFELN